MIKINKLNLTKANTIWNLRSQYKSIGTIRKESKSISDYSYMARILRELKEERLILVNVRYRKIYYKASIKGLTEAENYFNKHKIAYLGPIDYTEN